MNRPPPRTTLFPYTTLFRSNASNNTINVGSSPTIWAQIQVTVAAQSDGAGFESETTPDNTQLNEEASYTKSWKVKNTGTTTWTSSYSLQYVSGNAGCNHNAV